MLSRIPLPTLCGPVSFPLSLFTTPTLLPPSSVSSGTLLLPAVRNLKLWDSVWCLPEHGSSILLLALRETGKPGKHPLFKVIASVMLFSFPHHQFFKNLPTRWFSLAYRHGIVFPSLKQTNKTKNLIWCHFLLKVPFLLTFSRKFHESVAYTTVSNYFFPCTVSNFSFWNNFRFIGKLQR